MKLEKWLAAQANLVRRSLLASVGSALAGGLLLIVQSWILVRIAEGVIFRHDTLSAVLPYVWLMVLAIGLRAFAAWVSERAAFTSSSAVRLHLRKAVYARIQELGPLQLAGERSGEIASTLTERIEALEDYYAHYLPQRAVAAAVPLAILAFVFPLDLTSGIILTATALAIPVLMIVVGEGAEAMNRAKWRTLKRMSARFLDLIQGLPTLKLLGASRREGQTITHISEEYRKSSMAVMRVAFLSALMLELFSTVSIALVAVSIGLRLMEGDMRFQAGYFILLLAPEFYLPLRALGTYYHARMNAIGAAERIVEILESPSPARRSGPRGGARVARALAVGEPVEIAVEELSFAYREGEKVLAGVSFRLEPGRSTALVGPSGAGKSTLLGLLLGFLSPNGGTIRINGIDLAEIPLPLWRARVNWLAQRPHLFHGSILDNLCLGQEGCTMERVRAAAQKAHADEFIAELPAGYGTPVGEGGQGLSGGQVQRLALARAFLKEAPLILLDEAGAHMDSVSERAVLAGIRELARGRTLLTIAHRLATVEEADAILVLDGGRIVEEGRHQALVERGGRYAAMVAASRGTA